MSESRICSYYFGTFHLGLASECIYIHDTLVGVRSGKRLVDSINQKDIN